MLISLILLAIIAAGGMALTYLIVNDEPLMWRLSAGTVIGSAIFGTLAFVAASLAGLSVVTASICLALTAAPAALSPPIPPPSRHLRSAGHRADTVLG